MNKHLVVLLGPTGIGKTDLGILIARHFNTVIISADSRQVFREMKIGTATPNPEQLKAVQHYFIGSQSIHDYFSAFEFEREALAVCEDTFKEKKHIIMVGGSMMYIDAICKGMDDIPTIDPVVRENLQNRYKNEGIESMRMELKRLDPVFYNQVDLKNAKRIIHALEICFMSGKPYSSLRTNRIKPRNFQIIKIGLQREREELYSRINQRVDQMIADGLIEEAHSLFKYRHLNSLNTVGYKELFDCFKGDISLDKAVELIKRNSRRYAKRQISWFGRDKMIKWFHPDNDEKIIDFLEKETQTL